MKPIKSLLGGAALFEIPRFEDRRGSFSVLFQADLAEQAGVSPVFVQDNRSVSRSVGTIRGLHLQLPPFAQGKLVRVVQGRVVDVFVDLRPGSPTHGHYDSVELEAEDDRQLWIPAGFAHGFCTLEPDTEVHYKVDAPYHPASERTLAWDDPTVGVEWPVEAGAATLSDKDLDGWTMGEVVEAIEVASTS